MISFKPDEIKFLEDRIKELENYKKQGVTRLCFPIGQRFEVDIALKTLKKILKNNG